MIIDNDYPMLLMHKPHIKVPLGSSKTVVKIFEDFL